MKALPVSLVIRHAYVFLPLPMWVIGVYLIDAGVNPWDASYWSQYFAVSLPNLYAFLLAVKLASSIAIYRAFRSDTAYLLWILPPFSIWEIKEGLLRQDIGFLFVALSAWSLRSRDPWWERWLWYLLSFTHLFSGVAVLGFSLLRRNSRMFLGGIGAIGFLFLLDAFSWRKILLFEKLETLSGGDLFSLSVRLLMSAVLFLSLFVGWRNRHNGPI